MHKVQGRGGIGTGQPGENGGNREAVWQGEFGFWGKIYQGGPLGSHQTL